MITEYYIYVNGLSGKSIRFGVDAATFMQVQKDMVMGSRFTWIDDDEALNLDNVERISFKHTRKEES